MERTTGFEPATLTLASRRGRTMVNSNDVVWLLIELSTRRRTRPNVAVRAMDARRIMSSRMSCSSATRAISPGIASRRRSVRVASEVTAGHQRGDDLVSREIDLGRMGSRDDARYHESSRVRGADEALALRDVLSATRPAPRVRARWSPLLRPSGRGSGRRWRRRSRQQVARR
jgi:hypothetical protein